MTHLNNTEKEMKELGNKIQKIELGNAETRDYFDKKIDSIKDSIIIWNQLEEYTIPYIYIRKIKDINLFLDSTDYPDIINMYRKNSGWTHDLPYTFNSYSLKDKDLKKMSIENSTFIKNAKIFSDISKTLYWDSRPILSYYSVSQLFSFFISSIAIFPENTKIYHHGLRLEKNNVPDNLKIKYHGYGGSFHRIVKTFSFIFNGSIFSDYLIDFIDGSTKSREQVELYPNNNVFSIDKEKERSFMIKDLFDLSQSKLEDHYEEIKLKWIHTEMKSRYINSSKLLKNYILIFAACSLARYYPSLWKTIYEGESSDHFLHYKNAIENIEEMVSFISDELKRFEQKRKNGFRHSLWSY